MTRYSAPQTKQEYDVLCDEVWRHNRLYFQEAAPEISDEEFDFLVRLVEEAERTHPEWISVTSPTRRIGEEPLDGLQEVKHAIAMLSLDKAFTKEELEAFYSRVQKLVDRKTVSFFAEPKIDGLALSAVYEHGTLVRAVTRGNGEVGSDITHNFKAMKQVPLRLPLGASDLLEVRGEVFLTFDSFKKMNEQRALEGLELFANPRNAAAGTLKLLDTKEFVKRGHMSVLFYSIARSHPTKIMYQHEVLPYLHSFGLPTLLDFGQNAPEVGLVQSVGEMMAYQNVLLQKRATLPFGIDGAVFKLDTLEEAEAIAPTAKHSRVDIAWKFQAEQAWTVLKEITLQIGRTGVITPVAELEPVELAGTIVSRATLHNEEEIHRKDFRPLDRVLIEKGGDIIPKVVMREPTQENRSPPFHMPSKCPICHTSLVKELQQVAWYCTNHACPEQCVRRLCHFVGKDGLDIEFVGESLIRQLYAMGYVRLYGDLFAVTKEQLFTLEGIKEKAASRILQSLQKAKKPALDRFLMAVGVKFVGTQSAKALAEHFGTLEKLTKATHSELVAIDGVGEKVAEAVLERFKSTLFQLELDRLVEVGVSVEHFEIQQPSGTRFLNEIVVLTGTLHSMARLEAFRRIEEEGGKISNTVTKQTTLVIVGEEPGSKVDKAKKLGLPLLSEQEFLSRLNTEPFY